MIIGGGMANTFLNALGVDIGKSLCEHDMKDECNKIIAEAKKLNCYKIVATSRYERTGVHKLYEKLGFENFGIEFKMYLNK